MFENYKLIQYSLTHDGKKLTDYILTDITTRVKLTAPEEALIKFRLRPGESPEDVAYEIYGNQYYHWVIMLVNNIYDVNSEWFLTDEQLYTYCVHKYNLEYKIATANINAATNTLIALSHKLNPNDQVTLSSTSMPGGLSPNVVYFVFNTTIDSFQLTANIHDTAPIDITSAGSGATVTCDRTTYPAYWIDDQENIISSALDTFNGWSNDENTRISYTNQITAIIAQQASKRSYITAAQKSVIESSTDVLDIVEEVTPSSQIVERHFRVLTNYGYEEMMNSRKQLIWVLKPEYINTFIELYNKAIKQ